MQVDIPKPLEGEKLKESMMQQSQRQWAYFVSTDEKVCEGVLCETVEQYEQIKSVFDKDAPTSNRFKVVNFVDALENVKKATEPKKRGPKPKEG